MRNVLLVIRREFKERVQTKSFVIGTVLFPVFMVAMWVLPWLLDLRAGSEVTVVVVDEAPAGIGPYTEAVLTREREGRGANRYTVERLEAPLESVRETLIQRVRDEEIDGFLHLPDDVLETGVVGYRARTISDLDVMTDLRGAATEAVQAARLDRAGLQAADVAALVARVQVESARITQRGEEGGSAASTFLTAYVMMFLIYVLTIQYGTNVMRSVLEEKTNRIAEVIVSSVRSMDLMLGKIVGVGSVALLQVGIWVAFTALAVSQSGWLASQFGMSPGALNALRVPLGVGLALLAFFLLGFFLYASVFAALGAAVTSEQEAQQLTFPVLLPMFFPLVFAIRITGDPLGPLATAMGWIPFTAPLTMPMRLAATDVPTGQILGSLAVLALTVLAMAWLAGKVYRVGILSTGKKPSLSELGRWLRAA
jgi:ABC-2 type transport system permease protein